MTERLSTRRRRRRAPGSGTVVPLPGNGLFNLSADPLNPYWVVRENPVDTPDGYMVETSSGNFATREGIGVGLVVRVDNGTDLVVET